MQPVAGGYGTMEAIYFGNNTWWDKGAGNGPWVMADLEVGVYSMGGPGNYSDANKSGNKTNNGDLSFPYPFVTAMLKGNSAKATNGGPFTLKGGNAQSGTLTTIWDGASPVGYAPMNRQGGIVLGVGGDNSSTAQGNFYEGVMTTGYASTTTDGLPGRTSSPRATPSSTAVESYSVDLCRSPDTRRCALGSTDHSAAQRRCASRTARASSE